jgi:hypothetical protein
MDHHRVTVFEENIGDGAFGEETSIGQDIIEYVLPKANCVSRVLTSFYMN